jgi:L-amino acid N-acyltransferase YncA
VSSPWRLRPLAPGDAPAVREIFNDYVADSFAAYARHPLTLPDIQGLLSYCESYPALAAEDCRGDLIGFAFLRPYSPFATFAGTATITYFIAPEHIGSGLGSALLRALEEEAARIGIDKLLAHVSSRNEASLAFHRKRGFSPCGTFHEVGSKLGKTFDIVWFEKRLDKSLI